MLSDSGGAGLDFPSRTQNQGGCARRNCRVLREALDRWPQPGNPRTRKLYTESLAPSHRAFPWRNRNRLTLGRHGESLAREDAHRQTHGARSRLRPTSCPLRFRRRRRTTDQEPLSDQAGDDTNRKREPVLLSVNELARGCRRDPTRTIQGDGVAFGLGRTAIRGSHRVTAKGYRGGLRGHHRFTGRHTSRRGALSKRRNQERPAQSFCLRISEPISNTTWTLMLVRNRIRFCLFRLAARVMCRRTYFVKH